MRHTLRRQQGNVLFFLIYGLLLVGAMAFILGSSKLLPPVIASHFNAQGTANGFMPRTIYTHFILLVTVIAPSVIVVISTVLPNIAPDRVNLPHREYWLDPARRKATISYLTKHAIVFGCALLIFLCAVHWQVVQANLREPVHLDNSQFFPMLIGFLVFVACWVASMFLRFRKPAQTP